jgi:hypothetical protein
MDLLNTGIRRAVRACKHSHAAYADPFKVRRMLDPKIKIVSYYEGGAKGKSNGHAYMLRDGQDIIVAFRGVSVGRDVFDALDIRHATMASGGKVHRGFYEQFASLEQLITRDLANNPSSSVEFVGHSMGGGMAVIAAVHYGADRSWSEDPHVCVVCHAFGCPRFADAVVKRDASMHVDRFASFNVVGDPVARIPIHPDFVGFGNTYDLHGDGAVSLSGGDDGSSSVAFLRQLAGDVTFNTHKCANYVRQLELVDERLGRKQLYVGDTYAKSYRDEHQVQLPDASQSRGAPPAAGRPKCRGSSGQMRAGDGYDPDPVE